MSHFTHKSRNNVNLKIQFYYLFIFAILKSLRNKNTLNNSCRFMHSKNISSLHIAVGKIVLNYVRSLGTHSSHTMRPHCTSNINFTTLKLIQNGFHIKISPTSICLIMTVYQLSRQISLCFHCSLTLLLQVSYHYNNLIKPILNGSSVPSDCGLHLGIHKKIK